MSGNVTRITPQYTPVNRQVQPVRDVGQGSPGQDAADRPELASKRKRWQRVAVPCDGSTDKVLRISGTTLVIDQQSDLYSDGIPDGCTIRFNDADDGEWPIPATADAVASGTYSWPPVKWWGNNPFTEVIITVPNVANSGFVLMFTADENLIDYPRF